MTISKSKITIPTNSREKHDLQEFFCLLTKQCNSNCLFCIEKDVRTGGFLSWANFEKAVEFARNHELYNFFLHGGEPTLHPDIVSFAQYAKNAGLTVKMFSNGIRYDVLKKLDGIVDEIKISYRGDVSLRFHQSEWNTKLYLGILATEAEFPTEEDLLSFVHYAHELTGMEVYVNTMNPVNQGSYDNQMVSYLEERFLTLPESEIFSSYHKAGFYLPDGTRVRMGNKSMNPNHPKYSMSPDGSIHDHFEHDILTIIHNQKIDEKLIAGNTRLKELRD